MDVIKLTDASIEVTNPVKTVYRRDELLLSKNRLQMDLNKITENFQARIHELDLLIAECVRLLPPIEVTPIEEPLKG